MPVSSNLRWHRRTFSLASRHHLQRAADERFEPRAQYFGVAAPSQAEFEFELCFCVGDPPRSAKRFGLPVCRSAGLPVCRSAGLLGGAGFCAFAFALTIERMMRLRNRRTQ